MFKMGTRSRAIHLSDGTRSGRRPLYQSSSRPCRQRNRPCRQDAAGESADSAPQIKASPKTHNPAPVWKIDGAGPGPLLTIPYPMIAPTTAPKTKNAARVRGLGDDLASRSNLFEPGRRLIFAFRITSV